LLGSKAAPGTTLTGKRPLKWSGMPTTVRSHAKINLGLGIGAPRADGFHALVTVYQTLEMHDLVTVTANESTKTGIRLTSNDARVPTDSRNTAWKMVFLVLEELGVAADVAIHIEKRLPVQGGLGAGSGNAVAALIGLEAELGRASQQVSESAGQRDGQEFVLPALNAQNALRMGHPDSDWRTRKKSADWLARELEIAARVGSDVPLFLIGGTILGVDRGQEVCPLPDIEPTWCAVAIPDEGVSTAQAFRDWDALCEREGLTPEASTDKLNKLSRAYVSAFAGAIPQGANEAGSSGVIPNGDDLAGPVGSALVRTGITSWIENDFERVIFPQHPSLREIKRILAAEGSPEAALYASLSGSGSALYGFYQTRKHAEAACQRLSEMEVRSELTRTLPRAEYWQQMLSKDVD
jgi:4-diphosphocytidyl-2-C-methyl-D-erythritol kinase